MAVMFKTMFALSLALHIGVSFPSLANASAFLRSEAGSPQEDLQQQRALVAELEAALGADDLRATQARLVSLEETLRPTFASLPKTADGVVGAAGARYALHRLFVQRHGWQVNGLEPAGEAWAGASPADALGERLPQGVKDIFEERIGRRGLNLHELTVLASTFESLIHGEAVGRLQAAYKALEHSEGGKLTQDTAMEVIDGYMALYVLGLNVSSTESQKLRYQIGNVTKSYPTWSETQVFLREVRQQVAPNTESFTFNDVTAVVEEAGERFGRFQDAECRVLKQDLVHMEESPGNGRVLLADFYSSALHHGKWQFSESVKYLQQLGALDESDPASLRVIIPNYINGPSNCIASSAFYGVCCIDECEAIMGRLESDIASPTASPADIAARVSNLPSASQRANRTLPDALVRRLEEVAEHHGGQVPLHGRLFAQWLHHAYPRECAYPHVSGTTRPQRAEEVAQSDIAAGATKDEMRQHIESGKGARRRSADADDGLCSAMWTMEEELVDEKAHRAETAQGKGGVGSGGDAQRAAMRVVVLLAAVGSFVLGLAKTLGPALDPTGDSEKAKKSTWPACEVSPKVYVV